MVRQWQEIFYKKDYYATHYTGNPDWVKLAEAFGIKGMRVTKREDSLETILEATAHDGPVVVDFVVEEELALAVYAGVEEVRTGATAGTGGELSILLGQCSLHDIEDTS